MNYLMVRNSRNKKTGPMDVTYSNKTTCPDCSLKGNGCYAESGPIAITFNKLTDGSRGYDYSELMEEITTIRKGRLWRHNSTGDLVGSNNTIDFSALQQLIKANNKSRGFTYTHYPLNVQNIAAIKHSNNSGFTINASTDNLSQAIKAYNHGLPTVTLLPIDAPKITMIDNVRVIKCPANKTIDCESCQLCQRTDRNYIIGFPVHGVKKKALNNNLLINIKQVA